MSAPTRSSGFLARLRDDEHGAVAATVAVSMLALVGTTMLAVDGGNVWSSRRNIVVDTDAAALAAARDLIEGACSASDIADAQALAEQVLLDNDPLTVLTAPAAIVCNEWAGRVAVSAERATNLTFGGLAGVPTVDVASTSIAQYGQVASGEGLRPIAICNKDPHFLEFLRDRGDITDQGIIDLLGGQEGQDLLDLVDQVEGDVSEHPTSGPDGNYLPGTDVHRVYFTRQSQTIGCGDSAGNWGWLDFDGGGGGAQQVRHWLEFGYDQPITVGANEDCAPEVSGETDCLGEPGAGGNSWEDALEAIYCPSDMTATQCAAVDRAFPIIMFDAIVCDLNGGGGGGGGQGGGQGGGGQGGGGQGGGGQGGGGGNGGQTCQVNGNNVQYDPDAFLGVALRDWSHITGNPNDLSYFAFEFIDPFITNGTIVGAPPGSGPGLVAIQQCGGGYGADVDDYCVVP